MLILKNTNERFGIIAIVFHWLMALIIIGLIIIGLYMTRLSIGLLKLKLYGWHKEWGILILFLVVLRIWWRFINIAPTLQSISKLERIAARTVHFAFYFFMLALPITGWIITSSAGLPVSFFGLILPDIVQPNEERRLLFQEIHSMLSYLLIITIGLHIAGALKHHFINRDAILKRMLWP